MWADVFLLCAILTVVFLPPLRAKEKHCLALYVWIASLEPHLKWISATALKSTRMYKSKCKCVLFKKESNSLLKNSAKAVNMSQAYLVPFQNWKVTSIRVLKHYEIKRYFQFSNNLDSTLCEQWPNKHSSLLASRELYCFLFRSCLCFLCAQTSLSPKMYTPPAEFYSYLATLFPPLFPDAEMQCNTPFLPSSLYTNLQLQQWQALHQPLPATAQDGYTHPSPWKY